MTNTILATEKLTRSFGGLVAVDDVTFAVERGSIHGLIGPNGAGKTTAFNLISGLIAPSSGRVLFDGRDITSLPAHARVATGICRTFQTPQLFEDMTALETVMTGCHVKGRIGIAGGMFKFAAKSREEAAIESKSMGLLAEIGLADHADVQARNLSYGQRRSLEIARALAAEPSVILFDEVTAGLNPVETDFIANLIRRLRDTGRTIVLVEHDMRFVMGLSDRVTVLNFGRLLAEGTPAEILSNEQVIEAYLGRPKEKVRG